ncbi:MAG: superoxide dismutase [Nanoarchaeota archaeon]
MLNHTLPQLPYVYGALTPYIDEQTMRIHHTKHHQAYVDKLNAALEKHPELQKIPVEELLKDSHTNSHTIPLDIRTAIKNNGGGHANHSFFWKVMAPNAGGTPKGAIAETIIKIFGSYDKFKEQFTAASMNRFGSGWAWLVRNKKELEIMSTPNQDSPITIGKTPLLCIDVWEHAYYLKYQNRRNDYITAFWNIVNWKQVEENYRMAMKKAL